MKAKTIPPMTPAKAVALLRLGADVVKTVREKHDFPTTVYDTHNDIAELIERLVAERDAAVTVALGASLTAFGKPLFSAVRVSMKCLMLTEVRRREAAENYEKVQAATSESDSAVESAYGILIAAEFDD
jgi:hypothetical protein